MDATGMEPRAIFASSVSKSLWNFVFTAAWALVTVFLLSNWSWWLAAASFLALGLMATLQAIQVAIVTLALPSVVSESCGTDARFHAGAVGVQIVEALLGLALCAWVYRLLFV